MKPLANTLVPAAVLLLIMAGLIVAFQALASVRDGGGGSKRALEAERLRAEDLDRHLRATLRSIKAQEAILAEVLAGRMALREAADRLQRLSRANPRFQWAWFRGRRVAGRRVAGRRVAGTVFRQK